MEVYMTTNIVQRERFLRVIESRVNKVLDNLDNLGKCSNKRNYEYTEEEVKRIFREIDKKVREIKLHFHSKNPKQQKFKL